MYAVVHARTSTHVRARADKQAMTSAMTDDASNASDNVDDNAAAVVVVGTVGRCNSRQNKT